MMCHSIKGERMKTTGIVLAIALGLNLVACSNDNSGKSKAGSAKAASAESTPANTATKAPATVSADSAAAIAAVEAVLAPYEECRAALAADKTDGVAESATRIATSAATGEAAVPAAARQSMSEIAEAAAKLGATKADDLEAVRLAFGEVSKPVVALLGAVPTAAAKYHVFECPMAKGFNRWVQPGAETSNPYMGTKMLKCGSEVGPAKGE